MESYKNHIENNYNTLKQKIGDGLDIWTELCKSKKEYMTRVFEVWNFVERGAPLEFLVTDQVAERMRFLHTTVDDLLNELKLTSKKKSEFSDYMYHTYNATIF